MENKVTVDGLTFVPYITRDKIAQEVKRVAEELRNDLKGKNPIFLCVLNGAFIFAADLIREVGNNDAHINFVRYTSYEGTPAPSDSPPCSISRKAPKPVSNPTMWLSPFRRNSSSAMASTSTERCATSKTSTLSTKTDPGCSDRQTKPSADQAGGFCHDSSRTPAFKYTQNKVYTQSC